MVNDSTFVGDDVVLYEKDKKKNKARGELPVTVGSGGVGGGGRGLAEDILMIILRYIKPFVNVRFEKVDIYMYMRMAVQR